MWLYEGFSSQVEDDGSPACALNVAGQGVRDFNHRSIRRLEAGRPGWQFAADACQALGELRYLADGLPQSFEQIIRALRGQLDQGHIKIDPGTEGEGNPAGAVEPVSVALSDAAQAARQMHRGITDAQSAINRAAYAGPDSDGTEPCCASCRSNADWARSRTEVAKSVSTWCFADGTAGLLAALRFLPPGESGSARRLAGEARASRQQRNVFAAFGMLGGLRSGVSRGLKP